MLMPGIAPISELRKRQAAVLDEVAKRPVVLTQHGRAVAVLVALDEWEQLLKRLEDVEDALDAVAARQDAGPVVDFDEYAARRNERVPAAAG